MVSFKSLFVAIAIAILAFGTNHFAGITAFNSASTRSFTCRTQAQWNTLAQDAKNQGFGSIWILGFDCNALDFASYAAAAVGIKVLAGIYFGTVARSRTEIDNDVQTFRTAYAKYGAERYVGLTIGNEVDDTPRNIMAKVYDVRDYLATVGINVPVSTVHTWVQIRDNPVLCGADFVGANAKFAYFDGGYSSDQAGDFVFRLVVPSLRRACPGKKVYIIESGWPSRGPANHAAVPSVANERSADTSVSVYAFE
ncbi:glycoside hydrolase superfamily [Cyathus striatus]|nr:glycoside hydrolase superfamily [Cyathus striatus]